MARARDGDADAYGLLYGRYAGAARRFARSLVTEADADDVVSEAFASVLSALTRGGGPVGSFAPYLMVSVRHECYRVNRRYLREQGDPEIEHTAEASDQRDAYSALEDSVVVRAAFDSLSQPFRRVLWHTVVDHTPPRELAARSGTNPHAVAVAAQRARRALGSAYLNQHLSPVAPDGLDVGCREGAPAHRRVRSWDDRVSPPPARCRASPDLRRLRRRRAIAGPDEPASAPGSAVGGRYGVDGHQGAGRLVADPIDRADRHFRHGRRQRAAPSPSRRPPHRGE